MADLGVGYGRAVVSDRAYGDSWFQTCPRLAQIVNVVAAETPNLSVGPNETEEQLSARLTGQSSVRIRVKSEGPNTQELSLCVFSALVSIQCFLIRLQCSLYMQLGMELVPSCLIQRKCTKESSESCLHPRQVNRHLQQDEELTSVRQVSSLLICSHRICIMCSDIRQFSGCSMITWLLLVRLCFYVYYCVTKQCLYSTSTALYSL